VTFPAIAPSRTLNELDPVPEGIIHIHSLLPIERIIRQNPVTRLLERLDERVQPLDHEPWMGFLCGSKVGIDAEVNSDRPALEPAPAAFG